MTDSNLGSQNKRAIFCSTEVAGALISWQCANNVQLGCAIKSNAKGAILSTYNIDLTHIHVTIVENTDKQIALILPYYSMVETLSSSTLADAEMSDVDGGEVLFSLGVAILGALGVTTVGDVSSISAIGAFAVAGGIIAATAGSAALVGAVGATANAISK